MKRLSTRKAVLHTSGPGSLNLEARTCRALVATEKPVRVYDWDRGAIVNEVLLMAGLKMPEGRSVPLLDSHNRSSTRNILGSSSNFLVTGPELEADLHFSSDADGESAFMKVREAHLKDVSIGYKVLDSVWIPAGKTEEVNGRRFEGPLKVSTSWTVKEVSLTPFGADEATKVRSAAQEGSNMNGKNKDAKENQTPEEIRAEAVRVERERISEIRAMCDRFGCSDLAERMVTEGTSLQDAQRTVLDELARREEPTPGFRGVAEGDYYGRVDFGREAEQKRNDAVVDGLCLRAGIQLEKPAAGANEYRSMSFIELARESLLRAGVSIRGLGPSRIAEMAIRAHTTSDFPYLMENAAGKVLRESYLQAVDTWAAWTNSIDATDFKEMSRVQLSEGPDLLEVPEHAEFTHGTFGDSQEVYRIYTFGRLFHLTRQAIVNDDLTAFTRIPRAWGAAAKRLIGDLVYAILTGNPNMGDGNPLFDGTNHANVGTAGVPGVTTLTEARLLMRSQTGLQGSVLNITPRFLICPAALETSVDALLNSISLDDANPGKINPFKGKLEPVIEPRLDAASVTAWYLVCAPGSCDTIELAFLDGRRTPYLQQREGWLTDGLEFKARLDVGAKALDWRGFVYNEGAAAE